MDTRTFDLGDILSVTTGRLVSRRHIKGVYDILGYMTGEDLYTHQLPRAQEACQPALIVQHPDLATVTIPDIKDAETAYAWLDGLVEQYGAEREVRPLPEGVYVARDPLIELTEMVGPERPVIAVAVSDRPLP